MFTSEMRDQYFREGYSIIRGAISPLSVCDDALKMAQYIEGAQNLMPIMQIHRMQTWFKSFAGRFPIFETIHELMGERPALLQTLFYFCKSGTPGYINHQDNFCIETGEEDLITAWVSLVDTYSDNGCLTVYPGSHKQGIIPVVDIPMDKINPQYPNITKELRMPETNKKENIITMKGDVVLIHGNVVHGSNDNVSSEIRPSLILVYIRPGAKFRPGNTAKRKMESL